MKKKIALIAASAAALFCISAFALSPVARSYVSGVPVHVEKTYAYFESVLKRLPKEETAVESGRGSWADREKRAAYKVYNVKEFYDETGGYYVPDETVTVFQFNTWNDAD